MLNIVVAASAIRDWAAHGVIRSFAVEVTRGTRRVRVHIDDVADLAKRR